jgi:hypothetical protein
MFFNQGGGGGGGVVVGRIGHNQATISESDVKKLF